jgi:hypothetical protein
MLAHLHRRGNREFLAGGMAVILILIPIFLKFF